MAGRNGWRYGFPIVPVTVAGVLSGSGFSTPAYIIRRQRGRLAATPPIRVQGAGAKVPGRSATMPLLEHSRSATVAEQ
jgi:hypothetical protein